MKTLAWIIGIGGLIILGFYALNAYIYTEKQPEPVTLSDGEHFGFVRAFTDNDSALDFDDAVWLTGMDGENAAIATGHCTEETRSDCLPNGYFIENTVKESMRVSVEQTARVVMQTWQMEETGEVASREISLAEFAGLINDPSLHWNSLPYTITTDNNAVIRIEEVYVP